MELINTLDNSQNEDDKGPFLSSNVKDIFKRRKEEKNKKGMKKMNLKSLLPSEEQDLNIENNINDDNNDEDDNEKNKMISQSNEINNEDNIQLEKKAKKNYKTIFNLHKNYDINFDTNENIKKKKNKNFNYFFKEIIFLLMNIAAFVLFKLSFIKEMNNNTIYYYLIYPITSTSFTYLTINSFITSLLLLFILVNLASVFHLFYMVIFYVIIFYQYHLSNNNTISINYFDPAYCHFFVYAIILIHISSLFCIIYYICYYFYLNGQINKNDSCFIRFLIEYWESERKIEKLEKYINLNLDQLITSKGYSHEENIINKKKNKRVIFSIIFIGFILVSLHFFLMLKKNDIFNCENLDQEEND